MKSRLIIRNLGPIKFVDLELGKLNILIGDQGTGKSTIAKLLIAIYDTVFMEIFDLPETEELSHETQQFIGHLRLVGISNYLFPDTEIQYTCADFTFNYHNKSTKQEHSLSLTEKMLYDFTYIPSERNLAITLSDSLFALMQAGTALSQLFLRFGNKFQTARKEKNKFDFTKIIGINYIHRVTGDVVLLESGKEISIDESSSGIQGSIALLTVFDYVMKSRNRSNLLVVEEPELNCFPYTQYKLVNHFVENYFNTKKKEGNQSQKPFLVTTHSPYILTSFNNLIYAHQIGQMDKESVNKIIEQKYWLNPENINAYQLLSNGTSERIISEDGLIMAEKIDSISGKINEEYDLIQDVKLGLHNK